MRKAMTPTYLDHAFLIQQRRQRNERSGNLGRQQAAPLFSRAVLCNDDPMTNADRLITWMQKRQFVDPSRISVSRVRKAA